MSVFQHKFVKGVLVEYLIDGVPQPITQDGQPVRLPKPDWPVIVRPMKRFAKEGDKGLGDIVERVIGPVGGHAYKIWYQATFGEPCGCEKRIDRLNERFPL
jgi:hypothetical protein